MWYSKGVERALAPENIVNINKPQMIVSELIQKLQQLDPNKEVIITDRYEARCYKGDFTVVEFDNTYDSFVDIGIDGCEER